MEDTPELFVSKMVEVFREVRRVLRDDGTLWLNFGDSYCGCGTGHKETGKAVYEGSDYDGAAKNRTKITGMKSKDMIGIPWMVAFALRADGWYLRSDIIWSKPNPMPESVTDRPTKAHEYVFLLTKSARYYYDADTIRESYKESSLNRFENNFKSDTPSAQATKNPSVKIDGKISANPLGRNCRTVWEIATQPTPEAHFATFPEALVEPCIKAGSKIGDTILDPFGGSGTTGLVARNLKRDCILIELNPEYIKIMKKKLRLNEQLVV
jgi:DNA modification methylase